MSSHPAKFLGLAFDLQRLLGEAEKAFAEASKAKQRGDKTLAFMACFDKLSQLQAKRLGWRSLLPVGGGDGFALALAEEALAGGNLSLAKKRLAKILASCRDYLAETQGEAAKLRGDDEGYTLADHAEWAEPTLAVLLWRRCRGFGRFFTNLTHLRLIDRRDPDWLGEVVGDE